MLQSKIAETPVNDRKNNTALDESKGIDGLDNHSEWYQIEVGTQRTNFMACGNTNQLCHSKTL